MKHNKPLDIDDDGEAFNEANYFKKMGFASDHEDSRPRRGNARLSPEHLAYFKKIGMTKGEIASPDRWQILKQRYIEGRIANSLQNIFEVRSANEWMKRVDEPQASVCPLFGDFWLKGEMAILFADTGLGKSILAVQIAESIARGRPIGDFAMDYRPGEYLTGNAEPCPILYLDFELSQEQFDQRYSGVRLKDGGRFTRRRFHPLFMRAQIKLDDEVPLAFKDLGAFIEHSINNALRTLEPKVLIVDNLSWLRTANTNASAALELMRGLKALKSREDLSILVLAHTPKRPFARPLTVNDLAGSKVLANLTDTMFAIGASVQGPDVRYVKQIKPRSTKAVYGAENVAVACIEKPSNFLRFRFTGFAREAEHLIRSHNRLNLDVGPISAAQAENIAAEEFRKKLIDHAIELYEKGHTQREIAEGLGIGVTTVRRYLSNPHH